MDVAVVNSREIDGIAHTFAPTGWTYNHTFVLWDYESGSLWLPINCACAPSDFNKVSEIKRFRSIAGQYADRVLPGYEAANQNWNLWKQAHPETKIMDR